jgi:2-polyprenyl-3-methyl-5-hydroxy-6-metoxy-1,4-benzoquinol methylase
MANNLFFIIFCNFIPYLNKRLLYRIKPQIPDPVLIMFHKSGNLKFLDIGCGAGSHAHFWGHKGSILSYKKRGIDVEGLEISPNARDVLKNKGVVVYADLKDVSTEKRYDCIRLNWSLEHVHHPSSYFFFIKSHLNPNGICFINVPNNDGLLYKIYPDCLELPIHLNHFTLKTLEQYAKKHHLKVVGAQSFSYPATFFANALIYPALANFKKMSLIEAYYLNRSLNKINDLSGNDLLVTLST